MTIRVQCAEAWDWVRLEVDSTARVRDVKQAAMAALMPDALERGDYVVKLRGIAIQNETLSLASVGARNGSTLLIMSHRRRPVR